MRFILELDVENEKELHAAALAHATTKEGLPLLQAQTMLSRRGEIDQSACLQMLLDPGSLPGCRVYQSSVED